MMESNFTATTANTPAENAMSKAVAKWFENRGIDPETATRYGIHTEGEGQKSKVIFPFVENGNVVNNKYRSFDHETGKFKKFHQDKNPKSTFWNADAIDAAIEAKMPLVITEGEMDALSLIEVGYPYVVSVPDGAPSPKKKLPGDEDEDDFISPRDDRKFKYLWNNWHRLEKVETFILAGDGDEPGQKLNRELSRRLGPDRCKYVVYPDGETPVKDINDVLITKGPIEARRLIDEAKLYPVKGLLRLSDFPPPQKVETVPCMIDGLSEHLKIATARLMVITGIPNHGKSTFADSLLFNLAYFHQWPICAATYEAQANEEWLDDMVIRYRSQLFQGSRPTRAQAEQWVEENFSFIGQNPSDDEDQDLTLEDIITNAEISVVRYGTKVLALDPWNEIEHRRQRNETETEYIGRALRELKRFARRFDVLVIIVAHTAKMTERGQVYVPNLYDINGSANWYNKCDYGIVVHRDTVVDDQKTMLKIAKIKKHGLLGKPGIIDLELDVNSLTFFPHTAGSFRNVSRGESA